MKVTLTVVGGRHNGQEIDIKLPEVLIGRDEKCHLQLDSEDISRVHCSLLVGEKEVLLRDTESSNGTFVNKRRIRGELQLEDGDSIQVGPLLFHVSIEREDAEDVDLEIDEDVLHEAETDPSGSKTLIGRIPVIDPDDLQASEKDRYQNRLKDLK